MEEGVNVGLPPEEYQVIESLANERGCTFDEVVCSLLKGDIEDWHLYFTIEACIGRAEHAASPHDREWDTMVTREKFFADWLKEQREDNTRIGRFARYVSQDPSWPEWSQMGFVYTYYLKKRNASAEIIATFRDIWQEYLTFLKVWFYAADVPTIPVAVRVPTEICLWRHKHTLLGENRIATSLLEDAIREENEKEVEAVIGIPKKFYASVEKQAVESRLSINDLLVSTLQEGLKQILEFDTLLGDIEIEI